MDSCFALLGARQHCVAKICNVSQRANAPIAKICNEDMCVGSLADVKYLRRLHSTRTRPKKGETAVHCCDPALSFLVMFVSVSKRFSRSISLAVHCLYTIFFWLIWSLVDPTLQHISYAVLSSYLVLQLNTSTTTVTTCLQVLQLLQGQDFTA